MKWTDLRSTKQRGLGTCEGQHISVITPNGLTENMAERTVKRKTV